MLLRPLAGRTGFLASRGWAAAAATQSRQHRNNSSATAAGGSGVGSASLNRLEPSLRGSLLRLHETVEGTPHAVDVEQAATSLLAWQQALATGVVPQSKSVTVPREPLLSMWSEALLDLDMPRFTRRHPVLLGICLKNMLDMAVAFEVTQMEQAPTREPDEPDEFNDGEIGGSGEGEGGDGDNSMPGGDNATGGKPSDGNMGEISDGEAGNSEASPDAREQESPGSDIEDGAAGGGGLEQQAGNEQAGSGGGSGQGDTASIPGFEDLMDRGPQAVTVNIDEGDAGGLGGLGDAAAQAEQERAIAQRLLDDFRGQWGAELEQVKEASDLMKAIGGSGFDLDPGLWQQAGWLELEKLR